MRATDTAPIFFQVDRSPDRPPRPCMLTVRVCAANLYTHYRSLRSALGGLPPRPSVHAVPSTAAARHRGAIHWKKKGRCGRGMYAILRVAKLKTMGQIGALGKHNERTRDTPNADAGRLQENVRLVGSGDWMADAQRRLDDVPMIRSDAVLGIEHVMTASHDFYQQGDAAARAGRLADWTEWSMT